tara:strand:+ start:22800 stop:23198 length:399 start_codon:yes stop_codon:yes gene_type:complete
MIDIHKQAKDYFSHNPKEATIGIALLTESQLKDAWENNVIQNEVDVLTVIQNENYVNPDTITEWNGDTKLVHDVVCLNINTKDYPDFSDAFISEAYVLDNNVSRPMTENELDELNNDLEFVHYHVLYVTGMK